MKISHLSLLTATVLLGQNLTDQATANPTCKNNTLVNPSDSLENCGFSSTLTAANHIASSISHPEILSQPSIDFSRSPELNHQPTQSTTGFNDPISALSAILFDLTLSPIGAIAFLLLIKPFIIQTIITDVREKISELGELELQLSTASQQAETLSNNFQVKLENLTADYQQHLNGLKTQVDQEALAVKQFDAIKSDWLSQLQNLMLEVYDARDKVIDQISKIDPEKILDKVYHQVLQKAETGLIKQGTQPVKHPESATDRDYIHQGNQLLQQGYYSDALMAYNQAIALNPNHGEAWYLRGNALGCLQQHQEALASYQRAIALQADRADFWVNRGHVLVKVQQYSEALTSYEKAIQIQPNHADYWQSKGNLFIKLNNYQAALEAYEKASQLEPEKYEIWHLKGNLLARIQQTEAAVIAYKQAVAIDPKKYESWYNLGNALGQLHRYVESVNAYNQALDLKSDDYRVWHNRGFMLGKMQRYDAAIASYEKAISLNPQNYESWYNRGNLLEQLHHYDRAIASYDKAIEIKPDDPRLWYNCGKILEKLQRYEEALVSYERALKIQPDKSDEIRLSLDYLLAKMHHDPSALVA
jgi:tetratricopeptide (TPR) repeat protein